MVFLLCLIVSLLTEVTSNAATVSILLPIMASLVIQHPTHTLISILINYGPGLHVCYMTGEAQPIMADP